MTDERRYDEREVAEIMERATASDASRPSMPAPDPGGLTLAQLQEIGTEVGIAPARIADAARALGRRPAPRPPRTVLGVPISVTRTVPIARQLDEEEWSRLLVDLRETFGAEGRMQVQGHFRSWTNGNLQVHVEPDTRGYRVRMQTTKGLAEQLAAMSISFVMMAVLLLFIGLFFGIGSAGVTLVTAFGVLGLAPVAYARATLPRWVRERTAQMEGLAERIPLLLEG
ncbi:MAG: hypothetical protein WD801_00640 [Gemmatimonadaceae bacterium]